MKATGIVRRIDDLGRVVIPKEVRRIMNIHEGDPLEIFTDLEGGITFKRYFPESGYAEQLKGLQADIAGDWGIKPKVRESIKASLDAAIKELEVCHEA